MSLTVYSPVPAVELDSMTGAASRADRADLRTPVAGLLSNGKARATPLLLAIGRRLLSDYGIAELITVDKTAEANGAGHPCPDDLLSRLARADFVLTASGDCGGCTSWTVADAIALDRRGVPAVAICTDVFEQLARFEAEHLGHGGLRVAVIPHPLADRSDGQLEEISAAVVPAIADLVGLGARPYVVSA
jgi:hypothetical protein